MISQVSIVFVCIITICGVVKLRKNKSSGKKRFRHLIWPISEVILNQYNRLYDKLYIIREWKKVGKVNQLYVYPFLSIGCRVIVREYTINSVKNPLFIDNLIYENNMFVMYNKETKCTQTNEKLKYIRVTIEDGFIVKFSAPNMSILYLNIKEIIKEVNLIECIGSFAEKFLVKVKFTDCGNEAATWVSKYLNKCHIGLGYIIEKLPLSSIYDNDINDNDSEIIRYFLPECTLLTIPSLKHLYTMTNNYNYDFVLNPNVIIDSTKPFEEDEWIWIKIGEVILKNIRPWPKLKTGISPEHIPVDMRAKLLLLYCQTLFPNVIRQGDDVYIYAKGNIYRCILKFLHGWLNFFKTG